MSRLRVCTLVSGSSANCTYIEADGAGILIDAGTGIRKTEQLLNACGVSLETVRGIFLTHEHSDHIAGLKTIVKKYHGPILGNAATLNGVAEAIPEIDEDLFCVLPTFGSAKNGTFAVSSFPCMHDSRECVGYVIETAVGKVGVCTDLGQVTAEVRQALIGCRVLVLESNHDIDLLYHGSYPYPLKQRIAGPCGHLSNQQCGEALPSFVQAGAERIYLAHLSKENNTEPLCLCSAQNALRLAGITCGKDVCVQVAPRYEPSEVYEI